MAWQPTSPPAAVPAAEQEVLAREAGLHRNLTARQLSMISIGGAIGTGLFLGSAISVRLAGPGVILSYVAGAAIALTLMWALGEMAVAHPVAGSFGVYAEMYIHRWAGFVVRYTYWLCQVVAIGSEVVAASIYCGLWFPGIPQWIWIAALSAGMIYVNARSVASFGLEVVAVTSGEAADPERALPRALRWTLLRLRIFYIGGLTIVVGVVPWSQVGLGESPFVRVFQTVGIPAAAGIMNFVVLTAALSSVNCNLYLTSRMIFSLAHGGYAPAILGRLSKRGTPVNGLLVSSAGMALALVLKLWFQTTKVFTYMIGAAFFGGLFVWLMIFVTHLAFRRRHARSGSPYLRFAPRGPWTSSFGLLALTAVLLSTWWIPALQITLNSGVPWLVIISLAYFAWSRLDRATS